MNKLKLPKSKIGKWGLGLSIFTFTWITIFHIPSFYASFMNYIGKGPLPVPITSYVGPEPIIVLTAFIINIIALKKGERSCLFILGFGLFLLASSFWGFYTLNRILFPLCCSGL